MVKKECLNKGSPPQLGTCLNSTQNRIQSTDTRLVVVDTTLAFPGVLNTISGKTNGKQSDDGHKLAGFFFGISGAKFHLFSQVEALITCRNCIIGPLKAL